MATRSSRVTILSNKSPEKSLYISRLHAAQPLDCSVQTIDKLIRKGCLRKHHVLGKVVLLREEVERCAQ